MLLTWLAIYVLRKCSLDRGVFCDDGHRRLEPPVLAIIAETLDLCVLSVVLAVWAKLSRYSMTRIDLALMLVPTVLKAIIVEFTHVPLVKMIRVLSS